MRTLVGSIAVLELTRVICLSAGIIIASPTAPGGASKLLKMNIVVGTLAGAWFTAALSSSQEVMPCSWPKRAV